MRYFIDFASGSLIKYGEELCGDNVEFYVDNDMSVAVLSDGLSSGVKANILATLTSTIALTMIKNGLTIEETVETIIQTLPVDAQKNIAYSTFTIVKITDHNKAYIAEFDGPETFFLRRGQIERIHYTETNICGKLVREASIDLKENDNLLIEVLGEEGMPLAKELMRQAEQMKARPYFNIVNYGLLRIMLENATEEQIKLYSKHDTARMKDMDAYIGIRASSNTSEISNIDSKIMEMYNKYYMIPVHFEERVKRTKWCILRYPNNSMAQMSKMTLEEFEDFYFNVCNLDYSKMSKAMDNLKELMNKTDKVHIIGPGTDLTFSIKGIPAEKYTKANEWCRTLWRN